MTVDLVPVWQCMLSSRAQNAPTSEWSALEIGSSDKWKMKRQTGVAYALCKAIRKPRRTRSPKTHHTSIPKVLRVVCEEWWHPSEGNTQAWLLPSFIYSYRSNATVSHTDGTEIASGIPRGPCDGRTKDSNTSNKERCQRRNFCERYFATVCTAERVFPGKL